MASIKCNFVWPNFDLNRTLWHLPTPSTPLLTSFFFSSPPLLPLLYLPPVSSLSSSCSSSLFSSFSTGWAGQHREYNLKLWDLSLYGLLHISEVILHSNYSNIYRQTILSAADSAHPTRGTKTSKYFIRSWNCSEDYNGPSPKTNLLKSDQSEYQELGAWG